MSIRSGFMRVIKFVLHAFSFKASSMTTGSCVQAEREPQCRSEWAGNCEHRAAMTSR
jgi:hypothetical protein